MHRIARIALATVVLAAAGSAAATPNWKYVLLCKEHGLGRDWKILGAYSRLEECDGAKRGHTPGHTLQCSWRDLLSVESMRGTTT